MSHNGINQDSLTRWDQHADPYNISLQSHPKLQERRAEAFARSQDTMGSAQVKLQNELLQKLQGKSDSLTMSALILLAKMGQFTFATITVPFYLAFVAMPKWLKKNLALLNFKFFLTSDHLENLSAWLAKNGRTIARNISSPILKFIDLSVRKWSQLFGLLGNKANHLLQPLKKLSYPYQQFVNFLERTHKSYRDLKNSVRHNLIYFPNKVSDTLQQLADRLKTLKQPLADFYTKVSKASDRIVEPPIKKIEEWAVSLREFSRAATQPVINYISTKHKALESRMELAAEKIANAARYSKEKIKKTWEPVSDKIDAAQKIIYGAMQAVVQVIPNPIISLITPLAPVWDRCRETQLKFKGFVAKISDKMKRGKEKAKKGIIIVAQGVSQALLLVHKGYRWVLPKILSLPEKIWRLLKLTIRLLARIAVGLFFLVRLMLAWVVAFFLFVGILVRQSVREIAARI